MRLGDLDDLKDHISELLLVYNGTELDNAILNAIDNAPTIEERPEGNTNCNDKNCEFGQAVRALTVDVNLDEFTKAIMNERLKEIEGVHMKLVRQCDACGKEYMRSYYSDKLVVNGSEYFICPSCVNKALKALHKTDMRGKA